ncbi:putative Yif1 family protein [Helianthus debilis subsp. tardiflorus]
MGIFLVKTMKRVLFSEVRSFDSSRHHYLLLFIALAQFPLFILARKYHPQLAFLESVVKLYLFRTFMDFDVMPALNVQMCAFFPFVFNSWRIYPVYTSSS